MVDFRAKPPVLQIVSEDDLPRCGRFHRDDPVKTGGRHAISFELIALTIVTPVGAQVFDTPIKEMGVGTLVAATIATAWNYGYRLIFDHAMLRLRGDVRKTPA
ncbi:MAG: chlorhexidine efflux transporter, partial [Rhodobacterales bacterium]